MPVGSAASAAARAPRHGADLAPGRRPGWATNRRLGRLLGGRTGV